MTEGQSPGVRSEAFTLYKRAKELLAAKGADKAKIIALLEEAIAIYPGYVKALVAMDEVCYEIEDFERGRRATQKLSEIEPRNARYKFDHAVNLWKVGNLDEAVEFLRGAIGLSPEKAIYWRGLGVVLRAKKDYGEAAKAYGRACEITPDDETSWFWLGECLSGVGNREGAVRAYRNAVRLKSDAAAMWNNLAVELGRLERWSESAEAFEQALKISPQNAQYKRALESALQRVKGRSEERGVVKKEDMAEWRPGRGTFAFLVAGFVCTVAVTALLPGLSGFYGFYLAVGGLFFAGMITGKDTNGIRLSTGQGFLLWISALILPLSTFFDVEDDLHWLLLGPGLVISIALLARWVSLYPPRKSSAGIGGR